MPFLNRQQLFLTFLVVTLIDATSMVREWLGASKVGCAVTGLVLLLDVWVLWKLAWVTSLELPDPSYAATDS